MIQFTIDKLVLVKNGGFRMGDEVGNLWAWCHRTHTVKLTYDYCLGECEVTFNEYDAYCTATGRSKPNDEGWGRGTRPVINVSWWNAIAYCNWLSIENVLAPAYNETTGELLDQNGNVTTDITQVEGYRLPTEAEWEYAARGGQSTKGHKYAGSDDLNEVGWYRDNSDLQTHPVGEKDPNELGLYDMSGNVWEWCHDWIGDYASTTQTNPTGPDSGFYRVIRGGDWVSDDWGCRSAIRYDCGQSYSSSTLGFRVARTATQEE